MTGYTIFHYVYGYYTGKHKLFSAHSKDNFNLNVNSAKVFPFWEQARLARMILVGQKLKECDLEIVKVNI